MEASIRRFRPALLRVGGIAPADAYAALGKDDQKIYVVPSLDLDVTRLGDAVKDSPIALSEFDAESWV